MPKPELEFFPTESIPWIAVEGSASGALAKNLTEDPRRMLVTRMLKVDSRLRQRQRAFVHDFWEEVYILEGSQWDGDQILSTGDVRLPSARHETWSLPNRRGRCDV